MENSEFQLYLQSIHYTGDNIGEKVKFIIHAFNKTYEDDLILENKEKKIFAPPLLIGSAAFAPQEESFRKKVAITVIEDDESIDDKASIDKNPLIKNLLGQPYTFELEVEVTEKDNSGREGEKGLFTFSFLVIFSTFVEATHSGISLPNLAKPVPYQYQAQNTYWTCDSICLFKCSSNNRLCIIKCCFHRTRTIY